jgi:hypothetical protein
MVGLGLRHSYLERPLAPQQQRSAEGGSSAGKDKAGRDGDRRRGGRRRVGPGQHPRLRPLPVNHRSKTHVNYTILSSSVDF